MKAKTGTTESIRLDVAFLEIARQVKLATGIPISTFIERAIYSYASKLPKSVREKISEYL